MSGGAIMVAGFEPAPPERGGDAEPHRRLPWFALPLALAAGWGAFLSYSAMFLTEDAPPYRSAVERDGPALDFPTSGPNPLQAARRVAYGLDEPGRTDASRTEASKPDASKSDPVRSVAVETPRIGPAPAEARAATPETRAATTPAERPEHVGTWGPTAAACGAPHRRRGYYQATITSERAQAGRTICTFHDGRRVGNAWVAAAECSDRGRHWSSQVRLVVEGDRLTWTSAKGSSTYVRCGRRAG